MTYSHLQVNFFYLFFKLIFLPFLSFYVVKVLESGYQDLEYLGKILEYSLSVLRRLAAPASEDDMRKAHEKLLSELSGISQYQDDKRSSAFIIAIVKGLQFVLEEIQVICHHLI